ncbi:MAG TPA: dUTP diphosphatase [Verrucomicrobiae bacterium]|nr:dUTP diphosphatase [Verrucomicrobiae bacterium]
MTHMGEPNGIELKILDARIHTWGIPRYQSEMAAAVDLFACIQEPLVLEAQSPAQLVSSGIALHIGDPAIAAIVVPRSGLGHRTGLVMGNLVGVVDADYTGPVMISVWNRNAIGSEPIVIRPGDRIAQMIFVPVLRPRFVVVEEFTRSSVRGDGGFGSTGHALPASAP